MSASPQSILIIDFGSQVTQLIARRVRESGVYCEIIPFNSAAEVGRKHLAFSVDFGENAFNSNCVSRKVLYF